MSAPEEKFKAYLFSYEHRGAKWAFDIKATSPEDAKFRLAKIAQARYDGELVFEICVQDLRLNRILRWLGL